MTLSDGGSVLTVARSHSHSLCFRLNFKIPLACNDCRSSLTARGLPLVFSNTISAKEVVSSMGLKQESEIIVAMLRTERFRRLMSLISGFAFASCETAIRISLLALSSSWRVRQSSKGTIRDSTSRKCWKRRPRSVMILKAPEFRGLSTNAKALGGSLSPVSDGLRWLSR